MSFIFPKNIRCFRYTRLWNKLIEEHDWLSLFPLTERSDTRSIRWLLATGRLINYMVINTILAVLVWNDDGTCESYVTKRDCLLPRNLDQVDTLCLWDDQTASCSYNNTNPTFYAVVILAIITALLSLPFNVFFEFMVRSVEDIARSTVSALRTSLGRQNLEDDLELGDDLITMQTLRFKVLLSARLELMRRRIDEVTIDQEADFLRIQDRSNW